MDLPLDRDFGAFLESVRKAEEQMRPFLDAVRTQQERMQPFLDQVQREQERVKPFFDQMRREDERMQPFLDGVRRDQERLAEILKPLVSERARLAEATAGWAKTIHEAAGIAANVPPGMFEKVRRLAAAMAPSVPTVGELTAESSGEIFKIDGADAALRRFSKHAEAIARDETPTADAIASLAEDADALTAAAPADAKDGVARFVELVFIALIVDLLKGGVEAGVKAILPLLLTLPLLFEPVLSPPLPAVPNVFGSDSSISRAPLALVEILPSLVTDAGPAATQRTLEFFTAEIRNANTRKAYAHAVQEFSNWCEDRDLHLRDLTPFHVAAYIEGLSKERSAPTVKQALAALRMWFDYLVVGQVLPMNPAASVRGPKHVVKRGKTPVLTADQARALLDSIDISEVVGLRDRAFIGLMVYSFARVGAAAGMKVEDYYPVGKRWWFRLHEKGGKRHEVPAHHNAEAYVDAYLDAAGIREERRGPLFRSFGRDRQLSDRPMHRTDVLRMIKRRARDAGMPESTCCHTFRATGITAYLENGGTVEKAQQIAAHESPRTTKLYDRTNDELTLDEIERIAI